ncbi:MAG TPA: heavy metal transport/detoxification protein [Ruminococcaceae bacterium]|nr:heavy metal transport/detoxification protein [Oscillospiraceae bacterium]
MLFGKEKITKEVFIDGMSCMHCATKVEKALAALNGVSDVKVDLNGKRAIVKLKKEIDDTTLKATVEDLGYTVTDIK